MIREMSLGDIRKNFTDVINEVRYRHDSIILKKGDKSIAVLVDIELFDKLKSLSSRTNNSDNPTNKPVQFDENTPSNESETETKTQDLSENMED